VFTIIKEIGNVEFDLCIEDDDDAIKPCRSFTINGEDFDLTKNFTELHTKIYEMINNGTYKVSSKDTISSIKLVEKISNVSSSNW